MKRAELLKKSLKTVTKERTGHYGEPENVFGIIGDYWSTYIQSIMYRFSDGIVVLNETDVAMMMSLLKIGRQSVSPQYVDNYVDLAGYAACAAECAGAK